MVRRRRGNLLFLSCAPVILMLLVSTYEVVPLIIGSFKARPGNSKGCFKAAHANVGSTGGVPVFGAKEVIGRNDAH